MATKKAEETATEAPEAAPVMGYKVVGKSAIYGFEPGDFIDIGSLTADEVRSVWIHEGAGNVVRAEKEGSN